MTMYATVILQLVAPAALFLALLLVSATIFTAIGLYTLYWFSGKLLGACWWVQDKVEDLRESAKVWQ